MRILWLVCLFVFHIPVGYTQERVTPSERVEESISIREEPSSDSQLLGQLAVGESLELIGSVPWWHKVRLASGEPAFVAKAWSKIISDIGTPPADAEYVLHVVDVGTGLGIYVQGPDFNLVYDAGSMDDRSLNDKNRFIAYLKAINPSLNKVDHLIVSHPHRDHIILLPDVMEEYEVSHVWDSGAEYNSCDYRFFIEAVRLEGAAYHTSTKNFGTHVKKFEPTLSACGGLGDSFTLNHGSQITTDPVIIGQGATMNFLYINAEKHSDVNENSLVLRLDIAGKRLLLMGDAEAGERRHPSNPPDPDSVEANLLTCCSNQLMADVMVVGHHGSETSSRTAFLAAVGAKHYIISSGPFPYSSVTLPDETVRQALLARGQLHETNKDDDVCRGNPAKLGNVETDPDKQKPGGCSTIQVKFTAASTIDVKSFPIP